jgi:hypothetical protein
MTDEMNNDDLDRLLRGADPLAQQPPTEERESLGALHEFRAQRIAESPVASRSRWVRPRLVAGGTVAIGAGATAATLILGAFSSSPAFAVTPNDNGTVTVKVFRAGHVVGAINERLKAMGVNAKFVQVNAVAANCTPGEVMPRAVVIRPGKIPANGTIVLGADGSGHVGYVPKALAKRLADRSVSRPIAAQVPAAVMQLHKGGLHVAVRAFPVPTSTSATDTTTTAMTGTTTTGTTTTGTTTTATTTTATTGTSTGPQVQAAGSWVPAAGTISPAQLHAAAAVRCLAGNGHPVKVTFKAPPFGVVVGTATTGTSTSTSTTGTSTDGTSTTATSTSTTATTATSTVPKQ